MMAKTSGIFAVLCLLLVSGFAFADAAPLELTMDKTQLLRLDQDAASVIVANPEHLSVDLDNPRLLMLTPHAAGATSIIVLDAEGRAILDQDVVITNLKNKYVRVKRLCSGNDSSCAATSYAYCPDGCYEVTEIPAGASGASAPPPSTSPGTIEGEPAETMIGPLDDCPQGYNKINVPGVKGDMHYTCTRHP
jgi:hypothetical protein